MSILCFYVVETRRNDIDVDVTDEDDQSSTAQVGYIHEKGTVK